MIGVFDSGLGGLFLLKELHKQFPGQGFIYLADQAGFPYGEKSAPAVRALVKKNIEFLAGQGARQVIVACNTATVVLEEAGALPVPTRGVIEPALRQANQDSKNKKVGVLATEGTVRSRFFEQKAKKLNLGVTVYQQACPRLAPFVEEGGWDLEFADREKKLFPLLEEYVRPLMDKGVDTVIPGCTHYLYLQRDIEKLMGMGKKTAGPVQFLIKALSRESHLFAPKREQRDSRPTLTRGQALQGHDDGSGKIDFFITGSRNRKFEQQCLRVCGEQVKINIKNILLP